MNALSKMLCFCALVVSACLKPGFAGDPPFPDELKYPNIVPPKFQFGTYGDSEGKFRDPSAAVFLDNQTLVIADTENNRLQKFTVEGNHSNTLAHPELFSPKGMAVSSGGELYVTAEASHQVFVFDAEGTCISRIGEYGHQEGCFDRPKDVALYKDILYVADSGNCRIQALTTSGEFIFAFGSHGNELGCFDDPSGVAVDKEGNVYVADSGNNRIQKFNSGGTVIKEWGKWGSHAGLFATPVSLDVRDGVVYVADLVNHRLQAFNTDGKFLFQWGRHPAVAHEGNGRVHYPAAIAVSPSATFIAVVEPFENRCQVFSFERVAGVKQADDSAWWEKATRFHYGTRAGSGPGLLVISEPDTHSVLLFDNSGDTPTLINRFGGQGNTFGRIVRPSGVLITNAERGEFVASDSGNRRLQMFAASPNPDPEAATPFIKNTGNFLKAIGPSRNNLKITEGMEEEPFFKEPSAMAKDSDGNIYLCDPGSHQIFVYSPSFQYLRHWGGKGKEAGKFDRPLDIAVNSEDHVYVVDAYNFRVQVFDKDGRYLSSWGKPGSGDGEFVSAFGIAIGEEDTVFISDSAVHRIQKFSKSGEHMLSWGAWGTENGEFYKPKGLTVDDKGRVIVVDFGNHRAQIFNQEGEFISAFGIGEEKNAAGY